MRTRGLEFKVGVLIVIAFVLLVGFILTLGNFSFGSGFTLYVDFDYSGNIKPGAPVKVAGIKVGKVEDVAFWGGKLDDKVSRRVQVRLHVWLQDRVRDTVRQDAEFFVNTTGVLGEQYLEIVPGKDYDHPPIPPGTIVVGHNPPRTDLLMSRLYEVLDSVSELLHNDRDLIRGMLENTASAVREVDLLLRENRGQISDLMVSTHHLASQASDTLAKVNEGLGDPRVIARTMRDADALLATANSTLQELTPDADALLEDATRVTGIITQDRVERTIAVADRAARAVDKAGGLIDNVNGMMTDIRQGKGTVGALIVREEIYADLREMIRNLKRNPWRFFWKE